MRSLRGPSVESPWVCAVLGLLVCFSTSLAEEGKGRLELKKLTGGARVFSGRGEDMYRMTYPQHVFARLDEDRVDPEFARLVKKEPKYNARRPLRGVVKLAGQDFAFAVDAKEGQKKEEEKEKKPDQDEKKKEKKAEPPPRLDRLYFDLSHNGNLADDKPIDAESSPMFGMVSLAMFPRVDVTLELDGKKFDYAFFLQVYSHSSRQMSYASASLTSAAYREGELVLKGKRHKLVLLDFNSNGRFDDQIQLDGQRVSSGGALYPTYGDVLLVDPDPAKVESLGYGLIGGANRHHVSKLVNLDGRFHEMKVSASGEEISLRPASLPLGRVGTRHDGLEALLIGPRGVVQLSAAKDKPAAVPEGEWRLLAYKITARPPEKKPAPGAKPETPAQSTSLWGAIAGAFFGVKGAEESGPPPLNVVEATATADCKPIAVKKNQTTALPFGPPYRPVVKVQYVDTQKKEAEARLELVLVGAGGEVCTNLLVAGSRPPDPKFTIRDPKDKVVQQGTFKYG